MEVLANELSTQRQEFLDRNMMALMPSAVIVKRSGHVRPTLSGHVARDAAAIRKHRAMQTACETSKIHETLRNRGPSPCW